MLLLNVENYIDFAAPNPLLKQASNTRNSINKLGSELALRNPEYSAITEYDNTITKLAPKNSNSNLQIETTNIPHSLFALNRSTNQLPNNLNNFQRIANKSQNVLMMSNSYDETLMQVKQSTPSKGQVRGRGRSLNFSRSASNTLNTQHRYHNGHVALY